jgi:two-component system, LuxR family, sensor kinase FixL
VADTTDSSGATLAAQQAVEKFERDLGPFVVATHTSRVPMLFTDAQSLQNSVIYANQSFLELTGYAKTEAIGLPFASLLADVADRADTTPGMIAATAGGMLDLGCVRHDRSEFHAGVKVSPVCDKDGTLKQYFVSFIDVPEQIEGRAQEGLQTAEIYRHTPGFIAFSYGPEHHITFANTAYETLVGRRNLIGRRVVDALPEIAEEGFIELLDQVYVSGQRVIGRNTPITLTRGPQNEPETRYIDFIYEAVRNASGEVVGLFCEGSDITDAQVAFEQLDDVQAQLMHASRINAMGTMAATLAHEINQPLAAISNYAAGCIRILGQSGMNSGKLHEGLVAITAASERAGKIIRQLRDMTKRVTPANEIFDLSGALEESVHLVQAGGCDDVSISIQSTPSLPVRGDKIQVQQVIVNLLRNACHAAAQADHPGAVVALSLIKDGKPCVVIRDNGQGIPFGMRENVFNWTESDKADGMGIGLSVCRTIAENHRGAVQIEETGPGGTSFSFCLPAIDADA